MTEQVKAIIKWQYWIFNHGDMREIIATVFPELSSHLYDKWLALANFYQNTADATIHWFMDLSSERQERIAEWVSQNYHGIDGRIKRAEGGAE